ncbi:hypothetical protein HMI54_009851 [Coelomomyces lativittatus]|nr:hypothetical protein HMI54_009851 [Coelomomyces lativittatus]
MDTFISPPSSQKRTSSNNELSLPSASQANVPSFKKKKTLADPQSKSTFESELESLHFNQKPGMTMKSCFFSSNFFCLLKLVEIFTFHRGQFLFINLKKKRKAIQDDYFPL